jgi:transcriptional regulator with XRE-family HTH domain
MNVGERLRSLRKAKGLTTTEIAKKVNVSQSYISRFENNRAVPDVDMLEKICSALSISLSDFFAEEEPELSPDCKQIANKLPKLTKRQCEILNAVLDEWLKDE